MWNKNLLKGTFIEKFCLFIVAIGCLTIAISCSNKNDLPTIGDELKLYINVNGVIGTDIVTPNKASIQSKLLSSYNNESVSNAQALSGFTTNALTEQLPMGSMINQQSTNAEKSINDQMTRMSKAIAKPMETNHTYRILLYNKKTGKLWRSVQATSGTSLAIDVIKGDVYQWYAYSFNDNQPIDAPVDPENPTVETAIDKDFLYAQGEISIATTTADQQDKYNIAITFNHKVTEVHVKVDASVLAEYAEILSFKASFDKDSYITKGVFDIRGNEIKQTEVVPTTTVFNTLSTTNIWEKSFYSVDPAILDTYKLIIDELQVQFKDVNPAIATRNLATYFGTANKPTFTYNYTAPAIGQRLSGIANLWYTLSSKRILHISNDTRYGYSLERGPSWEFLNARENFGNLPNSLVKMAPWATGQGAWIGGNSTDNKTENWIKYAASNSGDTEILNKLNPSDPAKKPDIVILAYNVLRIRPAVATALLNYINNKGIVILMMQDNTGNDNKNFFNSLFGVSNIDFSLTGSAGAMYPLEGTDSNDIILNGRIGDARGQYWGEDAGTTLGIINAPIDQITIYSYGQAINRSTTTPRVTMFKHKTKNFFFIGDGGFVSYNGGTSSIICPFNYNATTKFPLPKPYGNAGQGYVKNSKSAYNSVVMGNIMIWAARTSEFDGFKPWKYAENPTP